MHMEIFETIKTFITENKILVIAAAIAVLFLLIFLSSYFSKGRRKGRAAEKKVAKALKKMTRKDPVHIMNNVYLPMHKGCCEIDHLVIGRFGILVVETKGISGEISGSGDYLTHKVGGNTHSLYNPQLQNKTHIKNVEHHLKKGRFEHIPVKGVVVFTDEELVYPQGLGMNIDGLKEYYKGLKKSGCYEDVLYDYFKSIQVHDPIRKLSVRKHHKGK